MTFSRVQLPNRNLTPRPNRRQVPLIRNPSYQPQIPVIKRRSQVPATRNPCHLNPVAGLRNQLRNPVIKSPCLASQQSPAVVARSTDREARTQTLSRSLPSFRLTSHRTLSVDMPIKHFRSSFYRSEVTWITTICSTYQSLVLLLKVVTLPLFSSHLHSMWRSNCLDGISACTCIYTACKSPMLFFCLFIGT